MRVRLGQRTRVYRAMTLLLFGVALALYFARPRPPPETAPRASTPLGLLVESDAPLPASLLHRLDTAIRCAQAACDKEQLASRDEVHEWAKRSTATVETAPRLGSRATSDGIVLSLPLDRALWRLDHAGAAGAVVLSMLGAAPLDGSILRAMADAQSRLAAYESP